MIKWVDRSKLKIGRNEYISAGEIIPAGVLTDARLKQFLKEGKAKKIEAQKPKAIDKPVEKSEKKKSGRKPKQETIEEPQDESTGGQDSIYQEA